MEPLKEMFGSAFFNQLAQAIKTFYPKFESEDFLKAVIEPIAAMSLNERMRHASKTLHKFMLSDYRETIRIFKEAITLLKPGYTTLIFPEYVNQFGTHDFDASLDALKHFTRFGSSEFAIRTFLKLDLTTTLKKMYEWSKDENEHVRRLSSEGSRPRLPWSFKLDAMIENPRLTQPILEQLKKDDSLYVRKSVANHLNDISKDAADFVLSMVKGWDKTHPHTAWIVKRGCRSMLKQGDKKSLAIFNFTKDAEVSIKKFKITPTVKIGDTLSFEFEIVSNKKSIQHLMIDYKIHFQKKSGQMFPKVFKLKEIELKPGSSVFISKNQSFKDFTTRKHYKGNHKLEIVFNGEVKKRAGFIVR